MDPQASNPADPFANAITDVSVDDQGRALIVIGGLEFVTVELPELEVPNGGPRR